MRSSAIEKTDARQPLFQHATHDRLIRRYTYFSESFTCAEGWSGTNYAYEREHFMSRSSSSLILREKPFVVRSYFILEEKNATAHFCRINMLNSNIILETSSSACLRRDCHPYA